MRLKLSKLNERFKNYCEKLSEYYKLMTEGEKKIESKSDAVIILSGFAFSAVFFISIFFFGISFKYAEFLALISLTPMLLIMITYWVWRIRLFRRLKLRYELEKEVES